MPLSVWRRRAEGPHVGGDLAGQRAQHPATCDLEAAAVTIDRRRRSCPSHNRNDMFAHDSLMPDGWKDSAAKGPQNTQDVLFAVSGLFGLKVHQPSGGTALSTVLWNRVWNILRRISRDIYTVLPQK